MLNKAIKILVVVTLVTIVTYLSFNIAGHFDNDSQSSGKVEFKK